MYVYVYINYAPGLATTLHACKLYNTLEPKHPILSIIHHHPLLYVPLLPHQVLLVQGYQLFRMF